MKFSIVANGKMQNCQYLGDGQSQSKRSEIWDSGGSLGRICATSGTLANGQVLFPNMEQGTRHKKSSCPIWIYFSFLFFFFFFDE